MEITVNTHQEFDELIEGKNIDVSKIIVDKILKNLNTKEKQIFIFDVNVLTEGVFYELILETKDFLASLEHHLIVHEEYENYEICAKILKAITKLKNG